MSNHSPSAPNIAIGSSECPIELDVPPWPESSNLVTSSWHPKLTGARLLVIFATIGLGTAKAVTAYRGDTIAPVTIEWVMTIVLFIIFLIFNNVESREDARPRWLFKLDTMNLVWRFLRRISIRPPRYQTEEVDTRLLLKPKHPPITGYRFLVTLCVVGVGSLKAALSFKGKSTEPTTIEWVFGVVITVVFYCLGLYEASTTRVLPLLFEEDYGKQLLSISRLLFLVLMHFLGLAFTSRYNYLWALGARDVWSGNPEKDPGQPTSTPIDKLLTNVLLPMLWLSLAIIWLPIGVGGPLYLVYSLGTLLAPIAGKAGDCIPCIWSWPRREADDPNERTGLVEWIWKSLPSSNISLQASTGLRNVLLNLLISIIYVVSHVVAFLFAGGWIGLWGFGVYEPWKTFDDMSWFMKVAFATLWVVPAGFAIIIGLGAMLLVLIAFFSPLWGNHPFL
ncbi:hypothetical protein BKA70DRAFT_1329308 [Coprinopsis sp. MPI-PUGE-AT-0042]|nr:hypothetical protein BKA70DRAFT_1329308 [Coprinopsis sp. MPI-PUGE-AT-0042]